MLLCNTTLSVYNILLFDVGLYIYIIPIVLFGQFTLIAKVQLRDQARAL